MEVGCAWHDAPESQARWQGHLAKKPVLDLMDETHCRLFSPVTLKSLSLHDHADFYGLLSLSGKCSIDRGDRRRH